MVQFEANWDAVNEHRVRDIMMFLADVMSVGSKRPLPRISLQPTDFAFEQQTDGVMWPEKGAPSARRRIIEWIHNYLRGGGEP
jgi:hypothetical protein